MKTNYSFYSHPFCLNYKVIKYSWAHLIPTTSPGEYVSLINFKHQSVASKSHRNSVLWVCSCSSSSLASPAAPQSVSSPHEYDFGHQYKRQ